jgi:zinc D-Ala-D-Ala carboxypeptidase
VALQGITGVTARVAEIQSRFAAMAAISPAAGGTAAATAVRSGSASGTAFANAYSEAVAATKPAATSATQKLNKDGIPAELTKYGNGKIPASALAKVGDTGHRLWAPAAEALERLRAAAKSDGVKIGITDSYRSYAEQVDVARRKGLYSQGGLAAKPGTSEHGWGMAADLDLNAKALAWMRQNAKKFGFEENTPREPWHWGFTVKGA